MHFNVRSITSHFNEFLDFVAGEQYDVIGLSETWLNESICSEGISIDGYVLVRVDRNGRGGGVAFYVRSHLKFKILATQPGVSALEQIWISLKVSGKSFCFGSLYRPPNVNLLPCLDDLENSVINFLPTYDYLLFGGDLNVDMLSEGDNGCTLVNRFFSQYNLCQLIKIPTRVTAYTNSLLDVLVTSSPELSKEVGVIGMDNISDHSLVYTELKIEKPPKPIIFRTYRDYKQFIFNDFFNDLCNINWNRLFSLQNVDEMVEFF